MNLLKTILLLSVSCLISVAEAQEPNYTPYYYQKVSLFEILSISSEDIVFLGNSLTDGCEWSELFDDSRIKNRGISGDVIHGVRDRLHQILPGKPAKIFLMIGINDVSHDLSADSIVAMAARLVETIRCESPQTMLYIQSILPVNDAFPHYKKVRHKTRIIKDINHGYKNLSVLYNCTYIDLYSEFVAEGTDVLNPILTNDGLHLTGDGYRLWKRIIDPYLQ